MWQITVAGEGTSGDDLGSPAERLEAWASMVAKEVLRRDGTWEVMWR